MHQSVHFQEENSQIFRKGDTDPSSPLTSPMRLASRLPPYEILDTPLFTGKVTGISVSV